MAPTHVLRIRPRSVVVLAAAAVAAGFGGNPGTADAYRLQGQKWAKRVLTVKTPARYRAPMAAAIRQWNTSGVNLRFRMIGAGRADITVSSMRVKPGNACGASDHGHAGFATIGASRSAILRLDPNCSRWELVSVAAHELGHNLGLGHERSRCALMNPVIAEKCPGGTRLDWEYLCRPIYGDDILGAIRRYGGTARKISPDHRCLIEPVPGPPSGVVVEPLPAGTLAATRISWTNPPDGLVEHVAVNRGAGACPNHPILTTPYRIRGGVPDFGGEFVADVPAVPGAQSVMEMTAPAGTWCYAVWTVGPNNRWRNVSTATLAHPGLTDPGSRLGVGAVRRPVAGVTARISWTIPSFPPVQAAFVDRVNGACPADPSAPYTYRVRLPAPTIAPGPVSVDDSIAGVATICYIAWVQKTDGRYYSSKTQV